MLHDELAHSRRAFLRGAAAVGVGALVGSLGRWPEPGIDRQNKDLDAAVAANVRAQANILRDGSTVLSNLIRDGKLKLVGGVYDLNSGKVTLLEG